MEYKEVKKRHPNLAREFKSESSKTMRISSYRSDMDAAEAVATLSHSLIGYIPDVIDYVRRCDTEDEAKEIIEFLRDRGEISPEYADRLMEQLLKHGVRSFGSKKNVGYYERLRNHERTYHDY